MTKNHIQQLESKFYFTPCASDTGFLKKPEAPASFSSSLYFKGCLKAKYTSKTRRLHQTSSSNSFNLKILGKPPNARYTQLRIKNRNCKNGQEITMDVTGAFYLHFSHGANQTQ